MPELTNRDELEARFARKLSKLSARHRRELLDLIGDPPDISRVPESFWDRVQKETEEEALAVMLVIFFTSSEQHGWTGEDAQVAAEGFAAERSSEFAKLWVKTGRDKLNTLGEKWEELSQPDEPIGDESEEISSPPPPKPFQFKNDTLEIFGPERVAFAAENETTIARHAGSEAAIDETVGLSDEDIWLAEPGACVICKPLNGKPRTYWERFFPDGPPSPHPGCRCNIEYANAGGLVGAGTP